MINHSPSRHDRRSLPDSLLNAALARIVVLVWVCLACARPVSAATITWTNTAGGDWTTAANWSPNAVPGAADTAVISGNGSYAIRFSGSASVGSISFSNANATLRVEANSSVGSSTLTVANGFVNQGVIELTSANFNYYTATLTVTAGTLTNATGSLIRVLEGAGGPRSLNANLDNRGSLDLVRDLTLTGNVTNSGAVHLPTNITLNASSGAWTHKGGSITGTGNLNLGSTLNLEADFTPGNYVLNAPNLTVNGPARLLGPATGQFVIRSWTINAEVVVSGDLQIEGNVSFNSALAVSAGRTLRVEANSSVGSSTLTVANGFVNQGVIELTSANFNYYTTILTVTAGTLTNATGSLIRVLEGAGGPRSLNANLDNQGTLLVLAGTTLNLNGVLLNASSGVLGGGGTFNFASATVTNTGTVAPGVSPGILTVSGNLPWNSGARFAVEMDGFTAGTNYDRLVLSSPASLAGTIRASLINGFFPKKDDAFTVLMYPSRTGSFTTLDNPLPDRIAWEVQYGPTSAQLVVLNTAPTLAAIPDQTVNEMTPLNLTASATDQDLPVQPLTYSLDASPGGMTIDAVSGQITWTPTEGQGPGVFNVSVRVTDNGTPALAHTNSFTVTVQEVNVAPILTLPPSVAINELLPYANPATATDADSPANPLAFALVSGPAGLSVSSAGAIAWTPTEAQGPGVYPVQIRVTDSNPSAVNSTSLSVTSSFTLTVNEVNLAPTLQPPANRTIHAGTALAVNASATDPDQPANALSYSKVSGPAGVNVSAAGNITWNTGDADANTTNVIVLTVTDNGLPNLSDTNSFVVTVNARPVFTSLTKAGSTATAVWTAIPGAGYRLQYKTNLNATAWSDVIGDVTAGGATASKADATLGTNASRFYRVFVLP